MTTCMPSCENFSYMMLNLVGEVGELAGKVAKHIRKEEAYFTMDNDINFAVDFSKGKEEDLKLEAGDIMWQISSLCAVMGWKLEDICQMNLDKLASRKQRNTIDGNGDHR